MNPTHTDDVEWTETDEGNATFRRKRLGAAAGGDRLGCSLYELAPGDEAWPYHFHTANEEALYVLSGTGTLRLDGETHTVRPGDYAAFPSDEPGGHKVVNGGDEPLRYLMLSTMNDPDVSVYPDSGKIGVFAGVPPGREGERTVDGYYRLDDDVDYWDGE